jgi:hypothetical protein
MRIERYTNRMSIWRTAALAAGAGVTALGAALEGARRMGVRRWSRATAEALERLEAVGAAPQDAALARAGAAATGTSERADRYEPRQLAGLPAPVVRYFTFALTPGQPTVGHARLRQEGTFATARDRWAPFTATETFAVSPPGFVWDARVRMAPLVLVHVRDSYVAGEGAMHAAVGGLVTIVDQRGTPELAAGALLRYLAEAAWLPTALLPGSGVRWEPVDDSTARATLTDRGNTVSMDVRFGAGGEIERVSAQRHRDVNGTPVLTPWIGRFSSYARVEGMMVPIEGEVGWELPDGWFPYWRGRTVKAELRPATSSYRAAPSADAVRSTQPPPSAE